MDLRKRLYQHGDVILIAVDKIPDGAVKVELPPRNFIIEKGEGSHTHIIECTDGLDVYEKDGVLYCVVDKDISLTHEEHGPQVITPGKIERKIEREWDYETEEARQTSD